MLCIFLFSCPAWSEDVWQYRKITTPYTEYSINATELCTINGITYIAVKDGVTPSTSKAELASELRKVEMSSLLIEQIKLQSVHYKQIEYMRKDYLPRQKKTVVRYFILSFTDGAIEAELAKNGILESSNCFRDLDKHLDTEDDIKPEIDAWAAHQIKLIGLDFDSVKTVK